MATPAEQLETNTQPAPFESAFQAIRFAYTRTGHPQRPSWTRMGEGARDHQALAPLDAAGQAGMVLQALKPLDRPQLAVLVAKTVPQVMPCSCRRECCRGYRITRVWREAISALAEESRSILPVKATHGVRAGILVKIYGENLSLIKIANDTGFEVDTISKYHRAVLRWLRGTNRGEVPIPGVETIAWQAAEDRLRDARLVG